MAIGISVAQAKLLLRLRNGESLLCRQFPSTLRDTLLSKGACRRETKGGGLGRLAANDAIFDTFVANILGITDLAAYANMPSDRTRTEVAAVALHSKALKANPLQGGWMLRAIGGGRIFVDGRLHENHPAGSCLFVQKRETAQVRIEAPILVGVENVDTFMRAESLFEVPLSAGIIMLRWGWGEHWKQWVREFAGGIVYLGDYDPKGVAIFHDEILPWCPDARYLIPENLGRLLAKGEPARFHKQESTVARLKTSRHPDVVRAMTAISEARKGLDQESLPDGTISL